MAIELLVSIVFIFLILHMIRSKFVNKHKNTAPMAAGAWPIIGHLPRLARGPQVPHRTLRAMADQYGPLFTIKLGLQPALVLSNWEQARECFTTHDLATFGRPKQKVVEIMGYNNAIFSFAPHGPYWREIRKLCFLHLLSSRQIELSHDIRATEIETSIKELFHFWKESKTRNGNQVVVDLKELFEELLLNIMLKLIVGKQVLSPEAQGDDRAGETKRFERALRDLFDFLGAFSISDAIPFLGWLDLDGIEKGMKKTAKELDSVMCCWLEEHKRKRASGESIELDNQVFMDALISFLDGKQDLEGFDCDSVIKSTVLMLIAGSVETTVVALTWAMSLLLNNPHELRKAQQELDMHVGRERCVKGSDINNLPYLRAIVKETLRLHPPAPLSGPREFIEDCIIGGYHVPKGTRLITNLWKIQTDPRVWPEPLEFKPERFLTTHRDIDFKGTHFELIPFGSGRRICPGRDLAYQVEIFTLASFLHSFEISTLSNDQPVDMTETFGLTNAKAKPLEVVISPRLSSRLY